MSESSGNGSTKGSGDANGADRRTIAVVAAIAVVALVALAALAIAVSARGTADAESGDSDLVGQVWKWLEFNSPNGERIGVGRSEQIHGRIHLGRHGEGARGL